MIYLYTICRYMPSEQQGVMYKEFYFCLLGRILFFDLDDDCVVCAVAS